MSRRRHVWQQQIVPMLNWIKYECSSGLTASGPWWNPEIHAQAFTYEELAKQSDGLDFRTDVPGSSRGHLYKRRTEMQKDFGLYFDDYPGGLRFTMLPKLGMLWRYEEEQKKTQNALAKSEDMTRQAIKASGTQMEAALFEAVAKEYEKVVEGAGRLGAMTQELFKRPDTEALPKEPEPDKLPAPRRRRRRPRAEESQ